LIIQIIPECVEPVVNGRYTGLIPVGNVPVIILSGSQRKDDMNAAYSAGANSYLVKPLGFAELVKLVKEIKSSWLSSDIR